MLSSPASMFGSVLSSASDYFYLPIDDEPHLDNPPPSTISHSYTKSLLWDNSEESSTDHSDDLPTRPSSPTPLRTKHRRRQEITDILEQQDLYNILGLSRAAAADKLELRRAYLSRSRACHPDKFPDNPEATYAFQKVSVAYNVLSNPASKRIYDSHPAAHEFASNTPGAAMRAEETLRSVVVGIFNDFLDGDLEMVRTLLRGVNDLSPSLRLGDEGVDSILLTLQGLRDRVLTCRALTHTVISTLYHLLDTHASLAKLSYFSLRPRARLSLRLARITLALPLALEEELRHQRGARARTPGAESEDETDRGRNSDGDSRASRVFFPRHVMFLIEGVVVGLEKMEGVLR
ncbi:DnaJ-domain-containing protein [Gloeopeniophorella convolvens]|nr:DnaJ-domain-containing protein [Gloeopeniophorella convolvens]